MYIPLYTTYLELIKLYPTLCQSRQSRQNPMQYFNGFVF